MPSANVDHILIHPHQAMCKCSFILPFQIVVPFIVTELDSAKCHCLRVESRSKLSQIQRAETIRLVCSPNGRRHQTPVQRLQPVRPTQGRKPASADLPVIAAFGCKRRPSMSVSCDSKCIRPTNSIDDVHDVQALWQCSGTIRAFVHRARMQESPASTFSHTWRELRVLMWSGPSQEAVPSMRARSFFSKHLCSRR